MRPLPDPPTLTGEVCRLRPWAPADAPALAEACGDEAIRRFTTVPHAYTPATAAAWIERQHERTRDGEAIVLAIVTIEAEPPVGMVGLFGLERADRTARLGYWLIARARRRGLATAAGRLLTRWGFERLALRSIFIDREPANLGSAGVAENLGATPIGSRDVTVRGTPITLERYEIVAPGAG